eukprot:FR739765.1.p1 GENE.FR739765.1~~FR739765.1.p1  ORF type:complete len:265 (+),score=10.58 FR739765.1:101-796(+)
MASDSFQLMGMADQGQLPKVLSARSRFGTPTVPIILSAAGIVLLGKLDFNAIIELVNILYAFAELIEFAAFIKLRRAAREIHRPYRIPVNDRWGVTLFFAPAAIFLLPVMSQASALSWILSLMALVIAAGTYTLCVVARYQRWCEFAPVTHDWDPSRDPRWMRLLLRHFGVGIVEPYEGKSEDGDDGNLCSGYRSTTGGSLIVGCYNEGSGITEGVFIRRGGVGPGSGAAV